MIGLLRGRVARKLETSAIIDCQGVGYVAAMSAGGLAALGPVGNEAEVEIYTHVREDALLLFGFVDPFEKAVFELLLSVSGIGPKMALNVLSGVSAHALVSALAAEDVHALTKISGIGKKTAERLVVELKGAVKKLGPATPVPLRAVPGAKASRATELLSALTNLGYRPAQVETVVERVLADAPDASLEASVREALSLLRTG